MNLLEVFNNEIFEIENIITESHGVVMYYLKYMMDIYNGLQNVKRNIIDSNLYLYRLENYKMDEDCFTETVTVSVYVYTDNPKELTSEYIQNDNFKTDLNGNFKLSNCEFKICLYNHDGIIDKNDLFESLSHEINHAYRYWSIISKNNGELKNSEKYRQDRYFDSLNRTDNMISNIGINETTSKVKEIMNVLYFLDNSEINSYCSETYELIRQNQKINSSTLNLYINEFNMNNWLNKTERLIIDLDDGVTNEETKEYYYTVCKFVFDNFFGKKDFSERKSFILLRQYISRKYYKAGKQFYKVIRNAFKDFGRINENKKSKVIRTTSPVLDEILS